MKRNACAAILALGLGLSAHAGGPILEREIEGFDMKVCVADGSRCVHAKSPKAVSSHFRPLFYMADLEVRIETKEGVGNRAWPSARGYYDLDMNQLVVEASEGQGWIETVIDLERLETIELKPSEPKPVERK